ncbi:MAG: hypothetical protein ABUS57_00460 [Pseudomonadota bacterium]
MSQGFEKIAERLKSLAKDGGAVEAVQVKLLGLDEIREAAGDRWPRMRERVHAGSLTILNKYVAPDDAIVPAGDGFLIVLAPNNSAGKVQQRCLEMREALLSFYLGEEQLGQLRPELHGRSLNAAGFTDLLAGNAAAPRDGPGSAAPSANDHLPAIAHAPFFATRDNRIGAGLCTPIVRDGGRRRIGYNRDFIIDGTHGHANGDFLELDLAVLGETVTLVQGADAHHPIGFSVHATTMQVRRTRELYLSQLAKLRQALGRNVFVIIAEIEKGTPLLSIANWIATLRTQNLNVWLDFHYSDHAIANVAGTGARALGFHLPIFRGAQVGPRAPLMLDHLRFWSRSSRAQGLRLSIGGFYKSDFLDQSIKIGFDFAISDEIWPFEALEPLPAQPCAVAAHSCTDAMSAHAGS